LEEGEYALQASLTKGWVESAVIPGFKIPLRALFEREAQMEVLSGM
jgi:hypothetical protein